MGMLRIITALAILGLGVYVAASPELVYAPKPGAVLFLLVAILPAILLAAEVTAEFKLKLPGFVATGGGSFAVMIIVLFLLAYFTKPTDHVRVFRFTHVNGSAVQGLDGNGVVNLYDMSGGRGVERYIDKNSIVVFFSDDTASCRIEVDLFGELYKGVLTYYGIRKSELVLKDGTIQ